jgi:restriction system protein
MKRLWLVRLGKNGEFEPGALDKSLLSIGFNMTANLNAAKDRDAVLDVVKTVFPDAKPGRQANFAAQVNQFVNTMAIGDIVVSPFKTLSKIGIGEVTGPYQQPESGYPARPVKWLATDVPRDCFKQDLLYSFGAIMTVCEVRRNDALKRVLAVARNRKDPGDGTAPDLPGKSQQTELVTSDEVDRTINLEQIARDQIERRISSVFTGHAFTNLIAAILTAQGYETRVSPPGPDSGIDIVAGRGTLGFDSPRLVVQVRSGDISVDQPTLQSLIGCVQDSHAEHGLLVRLQANCS